MIPTSMLCAFYITSFAFNKNIQTVDEHSMCINECANCVTHEDRPLMKAIQASHFPRGT